MNTYVGLVIDAEPSKDFSSLIMHLELNYGPLIALLPNFWIFSTSVNVVEILDKCEDLLGGHKAVCIIVSKDIAITDNMKDLI